MLRIFFILLLLLCPKFLYGAVAKSCRIYPIHPQADLSKYKSTYGNTRKCKTILLSIDSDGDGTSDWTDHMDGQTIDGLIMNDMDIDGDGRKNFMDPAPFDFAETGRASGYPDHLLSGPSNIDRGRSAKINQSQIAMWEKTGLISINAKNWHSKETLDLLVKIFKKGLSAYVAKNLTELRYVIADNSISKRRALAYYSFDLKALIVAETPAYLNYPSDADQRPSLISTLAHEIGHALAFSLLSANKLVSLANRFGSWKLPDHNLKKGMFSPLFFVRHPLFAVPAGAIKKISNFPTRYSLKNVHEWFAENFAYTLTKTLVENDPLEGVPFMLQKESSPLTPAFEAWIKEKFLR